MAKRKSRPKRKLKPNYIVLVDGESEISYINNIKPNGVSVLPEIPLKKSLKKMYKIFKEKLKQADYVFWIIDLDVVIRENNINLLKEYLQNYSDNIIINNPCLEYWFYLHFKKNRNFTNRCADVETAIKRLENTVLHNYKKNKNMQQLVEKLSPYLENAYKNAKEREFDIENILSCSQMFKIFDRLGI